MINDLLNFILSVSIRVNRHIGFCIISALSLGVKHIFLSGF